MKLPALKLIEIKGLHSQTDSGAVLFEDADADFYSGEKIAIIGPYGSGKTRLTRLFLGLDMPQRGRINILGKDTGALNRPELNRLRQNIGVVFEDAALISNLKIIENVILPLQYHTDLSDDNIMKRGILLLNYVGYKGDIWDLPGPLPFHIKKAIAMARAMILDPQIMIYDRLFKGLDAYQCLQMLKIADEFHRERRERLTIIMTNDEKDIKDTDLDRILRIEKGRII